MCLCVRDHSTVGLSGVDAVDRRRRDRDNRFHLSAPVDGRVSGHLRWICCRSTLDIDSLESDLNPNHPPTGKVHRR